MKEKTIPEEVPLKLRVGHLLRISSYLEVAVGSMWAEVRPKVAMGMAEASVRGTGPGGENGPDEELLARLGDIIREAREYYVADDFPAAMARMRVAEDLVDLRIIHLVGAWDL